MESVKVSEKMWLMVHLHPMCLTDSFRSFILDLLKWAGCSNPTEEEIDEKVDTFYQILADAHLYQKKSNKE